MFTVSIKVNNPVSCSSNFKSKSFVSYQLSKNKHLSIDGVYDRTTIAILDIDMQWAGLDHAGPRVTIGLLGFEFHVMIYDNWDYETNTWSNSI